MEGQNKKQTDGYDFKEENMPIGMPERKFSESMMSRAGNMARAENNQLLKVPESCLRQFLEEYKEIIQNGTLLVRVVPQENDFEDYSSEEKFDLEAELKNHYTSDIECSQQLHKARKSEFEDLRYLEFEHAMFRKYYPHTAHLILNDEDTGKVMIFYTLEDTFNTILNYYKDCEEKNPMPDENNEEIENKACEYAKLSEKIKQLTDMKKEISEWLLKVLSEKGYKKVSFNSGSVSYVDQREKKVLDLKKCSAEDLAEYNRLLEKNYTIQFTRASIKVSMKL